MIVSLLLVAATSLSQPSAAPASPAPSAATVIPAGTKIPLHLAQTISSHDANTGQKFTFYVDQDVVVKGTVVVAHCAAGSGTITLAGHHGINGHEGNLRLRFDTVTASDGSTVALATDQQAFNGKGRKLVAALSLPMHLLNGDDVEVKPDKVLTATVAKDVTLGARHDPVASCPVPPATPTERSSFGRPVRAK